jgi:hypothetical protein
MPATKQMVQPATIPDTQSTAPTAHIMASKSGMSTGMSTDMSTIMSEMQAMISAQSKMMEMFMQQQIQQMKQQQALTTHQMSSMISLVSQMIPQQHQLPPTYYLSPPSPRPPPEGMAHRMVLSQPPHMLPPHIGHMASPNMHHCNQHCHPSAPSKMPAKSWTLKHQSRSEHQSMKSNQLQWKTMQLV